MTDPWIVFTWATTAPEGEDPGWYVHSKVRFIQFDDIDFKDLKIKLNHEEVQATAAHLPFLSVETGNMPAVID